MLWQLRIPLKSCLVKRGAWLQSLGWRENLGRAGALVHDGDILTFDLQGDTLNGDDQAKPAKRVKTRLKHDGSCWPGGSKCESSTVVTVAVTKLLS